MQSKKLNHLLLEGIIMAQKEKQLVLIDLSARLPYGVMIDYESHIYILNEIDPACKDIDYITVRIQDVERLMCAESVIIEDIKPFLRPMSSMTEEEKKELKEICSIYIPADSKNIGFEDYGILVFTHHLTDNSYSFKLNLNVIDWLLSHHFDFRNLIELGLALEAPEGMY